jgi:hypothetical protein
MWARLSTPDNRRKTVMSFPIYLLDLNEGEPTIVFPEGKVDLDHSDFWERTVAGIVASHFKLNPKDLTNLPYCQRRARINDGVVYYGERQSKRLLRQIERAVGETGLRFAFDEHEARLEFDMLEFAALLAQS